MPCIQPIGGHAVFIDAAAFLPHIPQGSYPADVLSVEIYREGAIRGIGLGAAAALDRTEVAADASVEGSKIDTSNWAATTDAEVDATMARATADVPTWNEPVADVDPGSYTNL